MAEDIADRQASPPSPVLSSDSGSPPLSQPLSSESKENLASPIPRVKHIEAVPQERRLIQLRRPPSPLFTSYYNYSDWVFFSGLLLVTVLSVGTRLYHLNEPNHVA